MRCIKENVSKIINGKGAICEVVALFNQGYSKIIVDDGCYQIVNGDNISSHIFDEDVEVIKMLPNPKDLKRDSKGNLGYTLNFFKENDRRIM